MLVVVQNTPLTNDASSKNEILSRRGRSRQVSTTAVARQASEERRVSCALPPMAMCDIVALSMQRGYSPTERSMSSTLDSPSPSRSALEKVPMITTAMAPFAGALHRSSSPSPLSSMSPEHYDSPPSPPRSLEDQVHEAYALEDIHLAKVLLLRLKGIEVTSDDDPRIAAVQDEDFDFCFLPNGPLLSEQDEKALKELQDRERRRIEESRRVERMKQCERKWVEEKQRLREQRAVELRRRERKRFEAEEEEEEDQRRRTAEEERRRISHRPTQKSRPKVDRKVVNYDHLLAPKRDRNQPFVYAIMIADPSSFSARQPTTCPAAGAASVKQACPTPTFDDSRTISFKDVLKSMEGQLFPPTDEDRVWRTESPTRTASRSQSTSRLRQLSFLDVLLAEVEYSEERDRTPQGKGRECGEPIRFQVCLACSASRRWSPSASPTTSSSVSRRSSWISFGTSCSVSSSSSNATTPPLSPMCSRKTSWLPSRRKPWMAGTASQGPARRSHLRHSCGGYNRLTKILASEGPLWMDMQPSTSGKLSALSYEGRGGNASRIELAKNGAGVLAKRMVELAKGFQSGYITAALFRMVRGEEGDSMSRTRGESGYVEHASLRAPGSRAGVKEVKAFLSATAVAAGDGGEELLPPPKYIALTSERPRRTVLPNPLPYQLHFKPMPLPVRSPFRCQANAEMHTVYPDVDSGGETGWRVRAIGNPVHLRLKALRNDGWKWELALRSKGGDRERLLAVTYEGIGRSRLSRVDNGT